MGGFQQGKDLLPSLVNCVSMGRSHLPTFIRNQSRERNGAGLVCPEAIAWRQVSKGKGVPCMQRAKQRSELDVRRGIV